MAGAAYEVRSSLTDDESFEFTCEWLFADGTDFPWSDYSYEYELRGDNCGRAFLDLSVGSGIAIDETNNLITFAATNAAFRLRPGQYRHGCRVTHTATGKVIQIFDGPVTVTQGNF